MGTITAKKSYKDGHVKVCVAMSSSGFRDDSVKVQGSADITSEQARELAQALISEADKADAKVDAKKASDERRAKWREREVTAGRMKVVSLRSSF